MARVADAIRNGNKLFITFEGGDGAGKSTQAQMLSDRLCANGIDVLLTREPGGTKIGEEIREILLNPACTEMASHTEMFLYAAARAQLAREVIAPALAEGKTVICDRWVDSSLVYQGVARRLGEMVAEVNRYAVADLAPDLTILLDIDSDEGLARACATGFADRLEAEGRAWHDRVRKGFLSLAARFPERILVVDAAGAPLEVHERVMAAVATVGYDCA